MKNILFITHYAGLYGANRSLLDLIMRFRFRSFKVWVLVPEKGILTKELEANGIPFIVYGFKKFGVFRWKSKTLLGGFYRDLVFFIDGIKAYLVNKIISIRIISWAKHHGIKTFYFNSIMTLGPGFLANTKRTSFIRFLHIREHPEKHFNIMPFLGIDYVKARILNLNKVILVSDYLLSELRSILPKDERKISVVHNCVDIDSKNVFLENSEKSIFTFGIFGMIATKKNQTSAIDCFSKVVGEFPNTALLVVGGGDMEALMDHAKKMGVGDKVHFTGFVKDVSKYYEMVQSCLICSDHEAFGRVTVEALLYKKPVIAKMSGAHPEILEGGKFGVLYHSQNELVAAMLDMIKNYELYSKRSEKISGDVKAKYEYPGKIGSIVDSLNAILE